MDNMFCGCSSIKELDLSNFNTINVKDFRWMFRDCCSLKKLDISNFIITEKIVFMDGMFYNCSEKIQKMAEKIIKKKNYYY